MTVSLWSASSVTPTIGTETFLYGASAIGVYTFHIDTASLVANDSVTLRVYQMILTGCTPKVAYIDTFQGLQSTDDQIKISVPVGNDLSEASALLFSVTQTLGTARPFPWKILRYS